MKFKRVTYRDVAKNRGKYFREIRKKFRLRSYESGPVLPRAPSPAAPAAVVHNSPKWDANLRGTKRASKQEYMKLVNQAPKRNYQEKISTAELILRNNPELAEDIIQFADYIWNHGGRKVTRGILKRRRRGELNKRGEEL